MGNGAQLNAAPAQSSATRFWPEVLDLPCQLCVALEVPGFTIRDLLSLNVNSIVDTQRREGAHVPVLVNGVMLGWAEFDVIENRLAVRFTEMV